MKIYKISTVVAASLVAASSSLTADATEAVVLPNAQPGECYAKVITPAKFETKSEQVLAKEASETITVVPAQYGTTEQKILVKEASSTLSVVPGTFKNVTEKVLVKEAETKWKTSLKGKIPVSAEILAAAKAGGADIDGMTVGSCYREYFAPEAYKTETETYIKKEASEQLKIVPATYEYVEEKVLVKEASQKLVKVPATYETVSEKMLVEPEKTMWKKSQCNGNNNDCGVMCLVTTPARYKTVTKRVVKTPPTTKVVDIPAVYKTVKVRKLATPAKVERIAVPEKTATYTRTVKVNEATFSWTKVGEKASGKYTGHQICKTATAEAYKTLTKTVVDTPPTTKETAIPEAYKTIKVTTVVKPAEVKRNEIPAAYSTITKRDMVTPSKVEWKRVVCQSKITSTTIRALQTALKKEGHYMGPIDGIVGSQTRAAVKAYQKKKGLSSGGITHEVIKSLGVSL
ncbi:MAG: peptidoglycan-binding protein [Epsilonproteobacteria bacterium]|nr:peptidoglycan-binding protein [Campylobacterota bacterium]